MPSGSSNWRPPRPHGDHARSSAPTTSTQRDRALLAHATQIDPDGTWFRVPREVQAQVWPTEEYEAALSYVPIAEGEDDLFAGLPATGRGRRPRHPGDLRSPSTAARRSRRERRPTADGVAGVLGFLAFFLLALALYLLMRNMNARMRRMSYRQQAAHRGKDEAQATTEDLEAERDGLLPGSTRADEADGPARGPASPDDGESSTPSDEAERARDDRGRPARRRAA